MFERTIIKTGGVICDAFCDGFTSHPLCNLGRRHSLLKKIKIPIEAEFFSSLWDYRSFIGDGFNKIFWVNGKSAAA